MLIKLAAVAAFMVSSTSGFSVASAQTAPTIEVVPRGASPCHPGDVVVGRRSDGHGGFYTRCKHRIPSQAELQEEDARLFGSSSSTSYPQDQGVRGPVEVIPVGENPCPQGGIIVRQVHDAYGTHTECRRPVASPPPSSSSP